MARQLTVAGEALIDLLSGPDGRLTPSLGGSPFNLALALGRLGRDVVYASPLSTDHYGQQLAAALQTSHVRLRTEPVTQPTSLAIVRLDRFAQPDYSFYREGVADRTLKPMSLVDNWPPQRRFFHVGSLSLIPPDGAAWCALLSALRARGVTTSVDINMRPMVAPDRAAYASAARAAAAQANWLKVSDEDLLAMGLVGDPVQAATGLLSTSTRVVILTCGARGAWCCSDHGVLHQPPEQVPVLDTVGAGDCFYAGFLASLDEAGALHTLPSRDQLASALRLGSLAAAHNIQRPGCQPPWRHELPVQGP